MSDKGYVISLADLTGNIAKPWLDAGYSAILVDPQHGENSVTQHAGGGYVHRWAETVESAMHNLGNVMREEEVVMVAGFPPCTDLAVSGARWFDSKRAVDPHFQSKAVAVAEQCRAVGQLSGAPWFVENPVSVLASVWGKPDAYFHPFHYTAYEEADNYTKKTSIWHGNGFVMPEIQSDTLLGDPDDRIHKAGPGPDRANFRSATPMGFAYAVHVANNPNEETA